MVALDARLASAAASAAVEVRRKAPGVVVSIPTRGNTLLRVGWRQGAARPVHVPFQSPRGETPCSGLDLGKSTGMSKSHIFQSPRGETPWSGTPTTGSSPTRPTGFNPHSGKHPGPGAQGKLDGGGIGAVSIPTRGNTLVRAARRLPSRCFPSTCFNPHSGKHPVPGRRRLQGQRYPHCGFNPHSGKHPVPGLPE